MMRSRQTYSRWASMLGLAAGIALSLAAPSLAHQSASNPSTFDTRINTRPVPLREVAFDQRVNEQVPLDAQFQDASGKRVQLRDLIAGTPAVLVPVYFRCTDLCPMLMDGVAQATRKLSLKSGRYSVIVFSFDARDTAALAASKQAALAARSGPDVAGWHFLTGDAAAIRQLTQAIGFRFTYDRVKDEFAHASGIVLLTPKGRIFRYQYGIEFSPQVLQLGLIEASGNTVGSPIDQVLLFCYHYDPATGQYTVIIDRVLKLAGLVTVGGLAATILILGRHYRHRAVKEA
ncbi:MAG TPA: SCO family protein [Candidatus Baltobacteraceae bacterium]|nr:SCO family protein [Candidatus Baltobacteraceae bacterium]